MLPLSEIRADLVCIASYSGKSNPTSFSMKARAKTRSAAGGRSSGLHDADTTRPLIQPSYRQQEGHLSLPPDSQIDQHILKLPNELLEEISYLACFETPSNFALEIRGYPDSIVCPAFTLGRVCRRWREVVHSSSRLWSSFFIDITAVTKKTKNILDFYISRNVRLPLKALAIVDPATEEDTYEMEQNPMDYLGKSPEIALEVLMTLVQLMDRAQVVALSVHSNILSLLPPLPSLRFPYLHSFAEYIVAEDAVADFEWLAALWGCINAAPRLAQVYIQTPGRFAHLKPFQNITSLFIHHVDIDTLLVMLSDCGQLERLRVYDVLEGEGSVFAGIPLAGIDLPLLVYLNIETQLLLDYVHGAFSSLTFPSLVEVFITSHYELSLQELEFWDPEVDKGSLTWPEAFADMLQRSGCKLQTLSIKTPYTPDLSKSTIPDILRYCPHLQNLTFRVIDKTFEEERLSPRFTLEVLTRLGTPPDDKRESALCPSLTRLYIEEPLDLLSKATADQIHCALALRTPSALVEFSNPSSMKPLEVALIRFTGRPGWFVHESWEQLEVIGSVLASEGVRCIFQCVERPVVRDGYLGGEVEEGGDVAVEMEAEEDTLGDGDESEVNASDTDAETSGSGA
ncbi:hypothetical protein PQX77_002908 [Marasmius sp. AFHP31]|nr:hypothetical protein PQX77_002908 [Marasmius sp. AFHP31]